jgi:hypothetical protein
LGFPFFFLYNLFFLLINFFSWLFTQGNLDLLPMLFVGMCLWIVSWTKVLNYKKAQWDQIEKDLNETYKQLKNFQDKMSLDELWNIFKTNVQETIHKHIPTKSIGNKSRLPWVNNQLKKLCELVVYFAAGLGLFHCKLYHDHSHRLVVMFLLY